MQASVSHAATLMYNPAPAMTDTLTPAKSLPVKPKSVIWNPSPADLRRFTEEMLNARKTEFGNVNVATRVVSRSKLSTFIATDTPENHSDQTITRAEYERVAKVQNDYIHKLTEEAADGYETMMDSEFMLQEFIDRFGPRMAHLGGVLHMVSSLGAAKDAPPAAPAQES